jgi:hypothetical protein
MKNIYIILFLILTISCLEQEKGKNKLISPQSTIKINISNELFNKDVDYSKFITISKVIKLETNDNSLIGNIRRIEFHNNMFYVFDGSGVLLMFDEAGKYLNKLNKKGKGPDEYLEMRDFFVDKDGKIEILSYRKVLTYDSNLKFIKQRAIKVTSATDREINPIIFLPNGIFTFLYTGSFGLRSIMQGKDYALYCIDNKNKIVGEDLPISSMNTGGHQRFYKSNDLIYFSNTYGNDTIYQVKDNYLVPKVYINFLERKITEKDMMGNRGIFYNTVIENELCGNLNNIYENNEYLCFNFQKGRYIKQGAYNKETKEIKIFNVVNGLPFPYITVDGIINDSFFAKLDPYALFEDSDDNTLSGFKKTFKLFDLKETDNPIIIKFKYKF